MIDKMLLNYNPQSDTEFKSALREIMQEVALVGLQRGGFFKKAAFYGGTALRIFYNLPRYSEDLDFSLLEENKAFNFQPYINSVIREFESIGLKVILTPKEKIKSSSVESAFLKTQTNWQELTVDNPEQFFRPSQTISVKIKFEVDKTPPLLFSVENKLLIRPISTYIKCFVKPDLFAGKMHALLFRKWKNRVKGRDWYDFEWYIKSKTPLNLEHFFERSIQNGDLQKNCNRNSVTFLSLLHDRIESVDFDNTKKDIQRFIENDDELKIWSENYFHDLTKHLILL